MDNISFPCMKNIGLLARGHARLEGARSDVEQAGGKALVIPTDVADADQVEAAAEKVEQTLSDPSVTGKYDFSARKDICHGTTRSESSHCHWLR
jgi:NAD(P)-dependent dehydrogenase (short-subunit alcohol dehydrogenase family)